MSKVEAITDGAGPAPRAREADVAGPALDASGHTAETACLNCSTRLAGPYCHQCGQHGHVHRTLSAFFHDLLHSVFHFEGRFWTTLPLLAWRPGELTRRYIDGQRVRFVSPIALFLFSIFLMFAVVSLAGGMGELPEEAKKGIDEELRINQAELSKLEVARASAAKAGRPVAPIDKKIGKAKDEIRAMEAVRRGDLSGSGLDAALIPDWVGAGVGKAARNPELVIYKLKTNAYKFSWLIIPLSVPFVWLLFPFSRRFRFYDHLVFVTYSICFMSLLVIAGLLFSAAGAWSIAGLLWLIPPFHMYRHLKGTYSLGRIGALWRTALLALFATVVVSLFATVMVGLGTFD
jgi:hypothetical protein